MFPTGTVTVMVCVALSSGGVRDRQGHGEVPAARGGVGFRWSLVALSPKSQDQMAALVELMVNATVSGASPSVTLC